MTSKRDCLRFREAVYRHYKDSGRSFPWRNTTNPYHILISEMMLQQTQTSRVREKYPIFIDIFPTVQALAQATKHDVLGAWNGLGYNRRALFLRECAISIAKKYAGNVPKDYASLLSLPGIGSYTAGAIMVFTWNVPIPILETNIRSAIIHHFFINKSNVSDKDLSPINEATLDSANPRKWYWALMDYGAYLKTIHPNPSRKSSHHSKQDPFVGSNRQVRGEIVRLLLQRSSVPCTEMQICIQKKYPTKDIRTIKNILSKLERERMIEKNKKGLYTIVYK